MTAPTISPETIEDIDYEAAVPCEIKWIASGRRVCDNEAEWIITVKCCGRQKLICDSCYQKYIVQLDWVPYTCEPCQKKWRPAREGIIAARRV